MRPLLVLGWLLLIAIPAEAPGQNCVKGKPCGNTCIARSRTCRVGPGSAVSATGDAGGTSESGARARSAQSLLDASLGEAECRIERVTDGDTIRCTGGLRVRLLLIDAPEPDQAPFGDLASAYVRKLLPVGSDVRLEYDVQRRDRYGRDLAYVYTADGRMVNEEIVRAGYAVVSVYPPNVRHVERIRAAAEEAREKRRGLWSGSAFECLPADHRRNRC